MVAANRCVGVAQDFPQLRIAEQPFDLGLHAIVELGEPAADRAQLGTGAVQHVGARIDAAVDRFGDRAVVFDGRQQVDELLATLVEARAVAIDGPGAVQCIRNFEQLLGGEHGADGRPANAQTNIVQSAEGRRLPQADRFHHFRNEGNMFADAVEIG